MVYAASLTPLALLPSLPPNYPQPSSHTINCHSQVNHESYVSKSSGLSLSSSYSSPEQLSTPSKANKQTNKQKHIPLFSDFPLPPWPFIVSFSFTDSFLLCSVRKCESTWVSTLIREPSLFPHTTKMISSDHVAVNVAYRHMIPKCVSPPFPFPAAADTDLSVFVSQQCCDRLGGLSNRMDFLTVLQAGSWKSQCQQVGSF